nr:MAG: hypothetical protein DIU55_10010 [Bacillota bacterium]
MENKPPDARRGQVRSLAEVRTDHLVRDLREKLEEFLRGSAAEDAVGWGLARFFPRDLFQEVDPEVEALALDWIAFVFPNEWRMPLARELVESDPGLTPAEQEMLLAWADGARPGLFRVESASARQAELIRIPDGRRFTARGLQDPLRPGDLLATWLLPAGPVYYLGLEPMLVDPDLAAGLDHVLQVEMEILRRQRPLATWDDLYRDSWPRIVWFLGLVGSGADVFRIQPPPGPSAVWDGRPVADAPAWWQETAEQVRGYAECHARIPEEHGDGAERLWWDAALTLRPKYASPDGWAAGVAYAFRRYVVGDPTVTQGDVAREFGVSAATVGNRSRQVVKALGLEMYDLRYVDLLARDVRVIWEVDCIAALSRPFGGMDVSTMSPEDKLVLHSFLRSLAERLNP